MLVSQSVQEMRQRVIGRVRVAKSTLGGLSDRVASTMSDVRLSAQGRQEEVERIVEEGRGGVEEEIAAARRDIESGLGQTERHLSELTEVTPEVLAARAAVLSPVLNVAMESPEALLNTYSRRFGDLTDRRLLEEGAQVVIDGLGGSDGGVFANQWGTLQEELSMQRPPEERQALTDRSEISELAAYLDNAERLAQIDLEALGPDGVPAGVMVARAMPEAEVNLYESLHQGGTVR